MNSNEKQDNPLLRIDDLAVSFGSGGRSAGPRVQAVDGVRLTVHPRQTLAVVGESGSGKSVTAMSAMRLLPVPPAHFDRGRIEFRRRDGSTCDLLKLSEREMRSIRGSEIAMIFQEPMTSLNPVYTVGDQIIEAILLHQKVGSGEAADRAEEAMLAVGITEPARRMRSYPHQFSGGMRQRVMIAMALACNPSLLLADEPTTALDVTIQAQILDLLRELQNSRGMGIMLITHALGVVAENADVVCVMYGGRVVEYARVEDLFDRPLHPYTRGLLASIPAMNTRRDRLITVRDVVDNPAEFQMLEPMLGRGARAWWPGHEKPRDLKASAGGSDSVLIEAEPGHWVGMWRTEAVAGAAERFPDLAYRVAGARV